MTFYIDVYFFVNLSVDLLCLFMASSVSAVPSSRLSLGTLATIGSGLACAEIFMTAYPFFIFLISVLYAVLLCILVGKGIRFVRRIRFVVFFYFFQILVGGAVYYFYGLLEKWGLSEITFADEVKPNRKLLIFAVILLLVLGVLRLIRLCLLPSRNEKSAKLTATLFGLSVEFSALVDSGNLLREPLSGLPVIMLRKAKAKELFADGKIPKDITDWDQPYQKRMRLIPKEGGKLVIGLMPDKLTVIRKHTEQTVSAVIGIDTDDCGFGGYDGLISSEVTEYV